MSVSKIELYKKTDHGIRYWRIEANYEMAMLEIEHGVMGGVLQYKEDHVEENQSGRTLEEQIDLQMESRASKKRDIGYCDSIEEAKEAKGMNAIGQLRPMLAQRFDKMKKVDFDHIYGQMKYDGHRCMITRVNSGVIAYSRRGKKIKTIDHILDGIRMPIGTTIDGELYCHGQSLQTITSWVKRSQFNTKKLEFIAYDIVSDEGYAARYNVLSNLQLGKHARVCPTDKSVHPEHVPMLLDSAISFGYEGLILRDTRMPYEVGKRSKGLIKVKKFLDAEYKVIDILPSKDGWGILKCETDEGKTFTVSAPGTHQEKVNVLEGKDHYIGHQVTVKYANLTNDGIPFHPVADRWRTDI